MAKRSWWRYWLKPLTNSLSAALRPRRSAPWRPVRVRPLLEALETRCLPATTVSIADARVLEPAPGGKVNMDFTVTRSGDLSAPLSVDYTTVAGSARAGTDFTPSPGTATFAAGAATATIRIPVFGTGATSNLTFSVQLRPLFTDHTDFATGSGPSSVAVGDFNGDGKPDLATANGGTVSVLLNETAPGSATAAFAPQQTFATRSFPDSVAVGDFNGDGKPDLAVANQNADTVSVLLNKDNEATGTITATLVDPTFTGAPGSAPAGAPPGAILGVNAFASVGQALAVARVGTLTLDAGTYAENLVLTRSVILQGAGSGKTIFAGKGQGTGIAVAGANGVVLRGLTIQGYTAGLVAGPGTTYLELDDVHLTGNQFGASVSGVSTVLISTDLSATQAATFFVTPTLMAWAGAQSLSYSGVHSLTVGPGSKSLDVFLNDSSAPDTVWVNAAGIARDQARFLLFYRSPGNVAVVLGNAPDTVVVQGQPAGAFTTLYVSAGASIDVFNVAVTTSSSYGPLVIDGGGGSATINVYDQSGRGTVQDSVDARGTGHLDIAYPNGSDSAITYQNLLLAPDSVFSDGTSSQAL